MDRIELPARYGYKHCLKLIGNNLWVIEFDPKSTGTYRLIGFDGENQIRAHVYALDPEGGPFLTVGTKVGDKTIKSITCYGVFELE